MLRRAVILGLALAAIAIGSSTSAAAVTTVDRASRAASAQNDLVALINAYRASNGVGPLSANGALTNAAAWMAADMAAKNYIAHVSSDGRSPVQRMSAFGYPSTSLYTGEDLGAGFGSASAMLAGWQASAAHNAVLLSPNYNAVGIGLGYNANSTYQAPRGSAPQPEPAAEETVDPEAAAQAAHIALLEERAARRMAHLFAVLLRLEGI